MCFANKEGKCQILNTGNSLNKCTGETTCVFCKTKDQVTMERKRSIERISNLPISKKEKILNTYGIEG